MPPFDLVKDDCTVGSAVLGKMGYNLSSTQSVVLVHVKATEKKFSELTEKRSNGFFDGVGNVAGCRAYILQQKKSGLLYF